MKQAFDFSFTLGNYHLPKFALYETQKKTDKYPLRYCFVENPKHALNRCFLVKFINSETGYIYSRYLDSATDAIARRFHTFAKTLKPEQLQDPVKVITCKDCAKAGAPSDRKPQRFIMHGRPEQFYDSGRSVTAGVVVGKQRLTEEGYTEIVLDIPCPV